MIQEFRTPNLEITQAHISRLKEACVQIDQFGEALDRILIILEIQHSEVIFAQNLNFSKKSK